MIRKDTFEERLRRSIAQAGLSTGVGHGALSHLSYTEEKRIKTSAVSEHIRRSLGLSEFAFHPSPLPRKYRTTSRRSVTRHRTRWFLAFANGAPSVPSELEPDSHAGVFDAVSSSLADRKDALSKVLSHVIVRGTYDELVVILNVRSLDGHIVRSARSLITAIAKAVPLVRHAWLYVDPRASRYYLDNDRMLPGMAQKKLLGEAVWRQQINDVAYQVGVFSFNQVNLSLMPTFTEVVSKQANVSSEDHLLDLYCGYGLFGAQLGKSVRHVTAIDYDETSVANARYNIRRAGGSVRAISSPIKARTLSKLVDQFDIGVIDPPRTGADDGVIAQLSLGKPKRIIHVLCNADDMRKTADEWRKAGYSPSRVDVFDMFPGTLEIEAAILFEPTTSAPVPNQRPQRSGGRLGR